MFSFLGIIVAIYFFAESIKNEPLRSNINSSVNSINGYLLIIKDTPSNDILNSLSKSSSYIAFGLFILGSLLLLLLPQKLLDSIFPFIASIFLVSLSLNLAIDWRQKHSKTVKDFFFKNHFGVIMLFMPTIIYLLSCLIGDDILNQFRTDFSNLLPTDNILYLQLIWFVVIFSSLYLFIWLITYPIYLVLKILIILFSSLIKLLNRYINTNILFALVSLTAFIVDIYDKLT